MDVTRRIVLSCWLGLWAVTHHSAASDLDDASDANLGTLRRHKTNERPGLIVRRIGLWVNLPWRPNGKSPI